MDEHLIINLQVADKKYPVRIKRKDEEAYRRAANEINIKLGQYKDSFTDDQSQPLEDADYIAMTAIQAVASKSEVEIRADLFESKLNELSKKLDNYLSKNIR